MPLERSTHLSLSSISRREFLAATGTATAIASAPGISTRFTARLTPGTRILFQGDSITDAGRSRVKEDATADQIEQQANQEQALGSGYPLFVAAGLLAAHPNRDLRIFNRGVSGNKIPDLVERWEADTIALKPDVLSILIGVNDYWWTRAFGGNYKGTTATYESGYIELLTETRKRLPEVRLVVMEPFVLRTGVVDATWFPEFDDRRAAAARVAKKVGATFVRLHDELNSTTPLSNPNYWSSDGVHPSLAGHAFIADRWRAAVSL